MRSSGSAVGAHPCPLAWNVLSVRVLMVPPACTAIADPLTCVHMRVHPRIRQALASNCGRLRAHSRGLHTWRAELGKHPTAPHRCVVEEDGIAEGGDCSALNADGASSCTCSAARTQQAQLPRAV